MKNKSTPPALAEVESFVRSNRQPLSVARTFFAHYESSKWLTRENKPLHNWKEELTRWMAREQKRIRGTGY